jgi:hypothetical protein
MQCEPNPPERTPAAAEDNPKQTPAEPTSAEVICFPGLDMKAIAEALRYWKRTGKPYKGAPD